ncbi:MAG: hypothetical protein LBL73_04780, partial [Synergistaceae bacterium]|nr:hypothetical protein [Synergistaceae bacterium]
WIRNVVVPQAERQFADIERKTTESVLTSIPEFKPPAMPKNADILEKIDQFIIAALAFRQELKYRT